MGKRKIKIKKGNVISVILIVVCAILFVYSLINVIFWHISNKQNNEIKETLRAFIEIDENSETEEGRYKVDFGTLKSQNSDVIGYLKINNTNIDYVVVKGEDNSYYLNHNFNKEWNRSGWIFADYHNVFDGSDRNIVIFGHDTKDGSMFGTLKNVLDKEWQENIDNLDIVFVTEMAAYHYQVFSTYLIAPEDYYINTVFKTDEDFGLFAEQVKSRSNYDYGVEVDSSSKVLTLSSCIGDGQKRVVLHAKLVK